MVNSDLSSVAMFMSIVMSPGTPLSVAVPEANTLPYHCGFIFGPVSYTSILRMSVA